MDHGPAGGRDGSVAGTGGFASLDLKNLAIAARNPDGTLPSNTLFRLPSGSKLVDKGVDAGLPFLGAAPDLGGEPR